LRQVGLGPQGHGALHETLIGFTQHVGASNRIGDAEADVQFVANFDNKFLP